jgi:broad specificity phosphatase PhoE
VSVPFTVDDRAESTMTELFLVRHGQASFGSADYDRLSPLGVQQSVWLGEYFAQRGIRFDRIATGSQRRHRQTAQGILEGMSHAAEIDTLPGLDEYDFAALYRASTSPQDEARERPAHPTAQDKRDFYRQLRRALRLWADGHLDEKMSETWQHFQQRVRAALHDAVSTPAKCVLLVTSGGPMGVTAQYALDAPDQAAIDLSMQVRNACFCQYFAVEQSLRLATFNLVPHLDQPDRIEAITYA